VRVEVQSTKKSLYYDLRDRVTDHCFNITTTTHNTQHNNVTEFLKWQMMEEGLAIIGSRGWWIEACADVGN